MRYISELREGSRIQDVYLCKHKQSAVTKNGKNYEMNQSVQGEKQTVNQTHSSDAVYGDMRFFSYFAQCSHLKNSFV